MSDDICGAPVNSRDGYVRRCRRKPTQLVPHPWDTKEDWRCKRHADREAAWVLEKVDKRLLWAIEQLLDTP